MFQPKSLRSHLTALLLAVAGAIVSAIAWRLGVVPSSLPAVISGLKDSDFNATYELLGGAIAVSLAVALPVYWWGSRRCFSYVAAVLFGLIAIALVASHFYNINLPIVPLVLAGALSVGLVHAHRVWQFEHQLGKALFDVPDPHSTTGLSVITDKLSSGLKLLDTVLPLQEAIVFQCSTAEPLKVAARLKSSTSVGDSSSRNSRWREGVKLCQEAIASADLSVENVPNGGANVAVPLILESEIVGALLIRLQSEFSTVDRPLLQAVSSQFARNLKRHSFSNNSQNRPGLNFFTQRAAQMKLDGLAVLKASLIEQQFEANALSHIGEGVALAYLDGSLARVNVNMLNFAGITADKLPGMNFFDLLDNFRAGVFDEPAIAVRRVLQTSIDYEGELHFPERNQTLGLRISLLQPENNRSSDGPVGLGLYVQELTRSKEYEKLKSDMISLMSHELRTPLTSINGFAELLTADETIPEQAREFVTIIANEAQRLSKMINTFLAVTQLQRKDKQEVLKIPLRLDEVVRETIVSLQPTAKKKRIRLVEQPAQRVPPVAADKSLITQAVKNLVHNAIKYSPERTTVTVSTELEAETVRVSVEDRGFGIPSEARDRVWEKFYRVVREGQEKDEESTGLGLSFVREVIEQHGGQVELDSHEGRGSKFSFTLPRL